MHRTHLFALALVMALCLLAGRAFAVGCLEPCPQDEMYSEEAEMCVEIDKQAWS